MHCGEYRSQKRVQKEGREFWEVHTHGGRRRHRFGGGGLGGEVERLGAGEIVLTSMDALMGRENGYDLEITAGGERGGTGFRWWPAAGPASRNTWPTRSCWKSRRRPGRQHFPLWRIYDPTRRNEIMNRPAAFPCGVSCFRTAA